MTNEDFTYKDLTKSQLDKLKDTYVISRLNSMNEDDLKLFVKTVIEDQVKGTVGNEEEKEAWNEIKEHFQDDFILVIKKLRKQDQSPEESLTPAEKEFERRLDLLKQRETTNDNADMW